MSTGLIDRWGPPVAVALAAISGAALVAAGSVRWWGSQRGLPVYEWFPSDIVVGLLIPAVGAVLVSRQPRNLAGWVLTAGALVGVGAFAKQYAFYGGVVAPGTLPMVGVATWLAAWTFVAFWVQPSLLALLFPDGRPASPGWRRVTQVIFGLVLAGALAAALRPDPDVEDLGLANPLGVGTEMWPFAAVMMISSFGAMLGGGVLGVWSLVVRAREAEGRDRAQVQWLLLGFAAFVLLAVAGLLFEGSDGEVLFTAGLACIPVAVAIAIVRHQLLDVEIVVNRTIVYVLLTGVGLVAYVLIVAVGTSLAGDRVPEGIVAAAVALGAVTARQRVQGFVDRRLFGARNDPYAVVETVGNRISEAAGPQAALDGVVAAVRETLRVPYVAVVPTDPAMPGAAVGHPAVEVEDLPVVCQGRRLATLRVGSRDRRGRFSDVEHSVLADVAQRTGTVLHAATLTEELSRSWQAAVAAREEERRRLRRDLHDGLGPALAGVALGLDGLGRRLGNDRSLTQRAEQLRGQLRDAVSEVRHIVEGLRPLSLDELGLAGAVERLASTDGDTPRISVEVGGPLPALSAAVEVATYRIAAEAVTNALRHANADAVDVRLRVHDGHLEITVSDDGRGFGTETVSGVGLRSMHERAAEVGGDLQLRSTADGGTSVMAQLPLEAT